MKEERTRLLVVGSGPAGLTAAIYAARAGLAPLVLCGTAPGGQLTITTDVENYPGFEEAIQGPELMARMRAQAERVGARLVDDTAVSVDLATRPFRFAGDSGTDYVAEAAILATGARARWLGVPGETEFSGAGVSACATCDGFFFRGREVAVIGGGNTAVEEALYLANLASRVTLVHRRDVLRAERVLIDRLTAHPKVRVLWNRTVEEIVGVRGSAPSVTGIRLRDALGGVETLPVEGVFVAIGHDPASQLVAGQVETDGGYVRIAPWSTRTSVTGLYAAGDVADAVFRQAVSSAGMGCMAALEAEKFLAETTGSPSVEAAERSASDMPGAW